MNFNYLNGITCPKEYVLALNDALNACEWKMETGYCKHLAV